MDKSKAYLVDSIYTSNGTIATMYADSLDDLGYDEYSGVDKNGLASGSVAVAHHILILSAHSQKAR